MRLLRINYTFPYKITSRAHILLVVFLFSPIPFFSFFPKVHTLCTIKLIALQHMPTWSAASVVIKISYILNYIWACKSGVCIH
ncbi:hypothetical protein FKM82_030493 [Ascaphus truei]